MNESILFLLMLSVLALLIAYLCYSIERRRRAQDAEWLAQQEEAKRQPQWRQVPGAGFDVSTIAPQIQRLRQDHLAARHFRPHDGFYRRGMLAAFRQAVISLSFFQRAKQEQETQKPSS